MSDRKTRPFWYSRTFFWALYAIFAALAIVLDWHADILDLTGRLAVVKVMVWLAWLGFLAYTIHVSRKENLFKSIRRIGRLHWGRQIGTDLYLGLGLGLLVIYLHGGLVPMLLWLVPTILFANLSILLYFSIHFDAIVGRLGG